MAVPAAVELVPFDVAENADAARLRHILLNPSDYRDDGHDDGPNHEAYRAEEFAIKLRLTGLVNDGEGRYTRGRGMMAWLKKYFDGEPVTRLFASPQQGKDVLWALREVPGSPVAFFANEVQDVESGAVVRRVFGVATPQAVHVGVL